MSESDAVAQPRDSNDIPAPCRSREDDLVLDTVVSQLFGAPYRYVLRRTGFHTVTAEDICQQTALDLVLYWDRQGGLPEVDAHRVMWTILIRRLIDHYTDLAKERAHRSGRGRTEFDEEPNLYEILADPCVQGAFDRVLNDIVQPQVIADLLHRIPPRQRAALVLTYIDQLDQADAANALGITIRGLQEALKRGVPNLKANYARLVEKTLREDNR